MDVCPLSDKRKLITRVLKSEVRTHCILNSSGVRFFFVGEICVAPHGIEKCNLELRVLRKGFSHTRQCMSSRRETDALKIKITAQVMPALLFLSIS